MRVSVKVVSWLALICMLLASQLPCRLMAAEAMPRLDFAGSVTWLGQVPILVAVEKGFFKDEGVDVNVQVILSSSDRIRAVTSGAVAFSNLGRSTVISEMARGNDSFFYFANVDDSPGSEGCWARAGFRSFSDLKGRKIAANTSAEVTMDGLLERAGMNMQDVQFVNLSPNEMALALGRGDVDAACVWQPLLDNLKKAAPDGALLGTDADTETYKRFGTMSSPDILIVSRKLVEEHAWSGLCHRESRSGGRGRRASFPAAARSRARWHQELQILRLERLARAYGQAHRADAVPLALASPQQEDQQRSRRQAMEEYIVRSRMRLVCPHKTSDGFRRNQSPEKDE